MNKAILVNVCVGILAVLAVVLGCSLAESSLDIPAPDEGASAAETRHLAEVLLRLSGVNKGLCVHLGCGDGKLTAALGADSKFVVHGLSFDRARVDEARELISSQGNYGQVSVQYGLPGTLPYADNTVNLLVADDVSRLLKQALPLAEVMRVLCPNGIALLGQSRKPALKELELARMLTARGIKDFQVVEDEGLWAKVQKRRSALVDEWTHCRYGPDGNAVSRDKLVGPSVGVRWIDGPTWPRLHNGPLAAVAANGRLFYAIDEAPPCVRGPARTMLIARDAYNGLVLWKRQIPNPDPDSVTDWFRHRALVARGNRVYAVLEPGGPLVALDAASGRTEFVYQMGGSPKQAAYYDRRLMLAESKSVRALDADDGRLLWRYDYEGEDVDKGHLKVKSYFVISDDRVFLLAGQRPYDVVCLDVVTGRELWRRSSSDWKSSTVPELVLCFCKKGVLLLGEGYGARANYALAAEDGRHLWTHIYKPEGYGNSCDAFFVDGLVWVSVGGQTPEWRALDPRTGEVEKHIRYLQGVSRGHHRCHQCKATERYFLAGAKYYEFVDHQTGEYHGVRSFRDACTVGVVPANGLVYTFPHPCLCFPTLRGTLGLTSVSNAEACVEGPRRKRLEKGPAAPIRLMPGASAGGDDWCCYRHDPGRSASTTSRVPVSSRRLWQSNLGGRISSPTVANGRAFVASIDAHRVLALDAKNGKVLWSYTADGRVDTAPAIYAGLVLFGDKHGWVYCLRESDGKLVWRFRGAPNGRLIMGRGQLESPWPVAGGILVEDGVAYFVCGRHMGVDGGIHLYAADPASGRIIWERHVQGSHRCNLLVSDGRYLYIGRNRFDLKTGKDVPGHSRMVLGGDYDVNLLGQTWSNRIGWSNSRAGGQLLVFDREWTFAVKGFRSWGYSARYEMVVPGRGDYTLFATRGADRDAKKAWEVTVPVRMKAMVLAGGIVFVAGLPDTTDHEDYWAAFEGKMGGELRAFKASDGTRLSNLKLDAPPVADGMAAAEGRLYLSTKDGKLLCFGQR